MEDKVIKHSRCADCGDVIWKTDHGTWSHYPSEGDSAPCGNPVPQKENDAR